MQYIKVEISVMGRYDADKRVDDCVVLRPRHQNALDIRTLEGPPRYEVHRAVMIALVFSIDPGPGFLNMSQASQLLRTHRKSHEVTRIYTHRMRGRNTLRYLLRQFTTKRSSPPEPVTSNHFRIRLELFTSVR